MQETYNRIRLELAAVEEMILRAKDHASKKRLADRRKALKAESHEVLQIVQAQQLAAKLEAQAKDRALQSAQRAEFVKDLHGVVTDFLPKRVRVWLSREARNRQSGGKRRVPGRMEFLMVLLGVAR